MKRFLLLISWSVMACFICEAARQTCLVKGLVTDNGNETIPYATIGANKGGKNIRRIAADANGKFAIELAQGETYVIEITSVGYAPYKKETSIPETAVFDLGAIALKADNELDEVVIEAQKPLIKSDAEKITYDVSADPEADNKTLIDMMRKVPLVTVDAEDNIQLNGSSNFKVLVNGKESSMMKNNLKDVLKSMPANSVKDIQVITNPSSKYDAEGTGGIINIITTRDQLSGFTGSVTGQGDIRGSFGGNIYLAMQYKKFTASINYSGGRFIQHQYLKGDNYNYNNPLMYHSTLKNLDKDLMIKGQYHYVSFESSYELDSLNLFSLGITGNLGNMHASGDISNETFSQSGESVVRYTDRLFQQELWGGVAANIDYQHTFGKQGHTLTTSYRYEYNPNGSAYSDSILSTNDLLNPPFFGQKNDNDSYAQEHTVQIDYVNPINEMHSIEGGAKYIARINSSNDDYMMLDNNTWLSMGQGQDLEYTQQILALYAGYGFKKGSWGLRAGGRYEATWIDATLEKAGQRINFGKPYGNFVPYISGSYNIDPMQTFQLAYTQRIYRPGIGYLSPFEQWTTPLSVQYGNPDLKPEVTHSITASYSIFKGVFNLNMQWNSRITSNSIESHEFVDAETNVLHNTYANIGHSQSHGLSLYISGQASPKFSYYSNLGASYQVYDAPSLDLKNSGWQAYANAGIQWTAWKNGTLSVNGGIGSPWISLQSEGKLPWYYYGLGITQRFFDDKLKITLSGNNFFNKYNRFKNTSKGDGFAHTFEGGHLGQNVQLSITYTFGKLNAEVKKVNRGIVNDDVTGGSSQGLGGQGGGGN